jgi:GTP-binding protein
MAIVAIVGRPNVGKSTLFNRLVGSREAIVDEFSGVTRDRHYGKSFWNGRDFTVIDTGGYVTGSDDVFEKEIRTQVSYALDEADIVLFVVDVVDGLTDLDNEVASIIRPYAKEIILVSNKADNSEREMMASEFYQLGMGEVFPISAINGSGTGELLDRLVEILPEEPEREESQYPKIAVVGRPNAGKSSFINQLTGQDRNIVTDVAGTTRDSINTHFNAYGFEFDFVDTAGLRKKTKVQEDLEFYSTLRTIKSIEEADVCILMVDATVGFNVQDVSIFELAQRNKKGIVILVNKWDLVENKTTNTLKEYEAAIRERIAPFVDVPMVFVSVKDKQRLLKALEVTLKVFENRTQKIKTSELNEYFLPLIEKYPPPALKGKFIKIKYVTMLPKPFPAFAFFANLPQYIKEPYKRFLENKLREKYDFSGIPVSITIKQK